MGIQGLQKFALLIIMLFGIFVGWFSHSVFYWFGGVLDGLKPRDASIQFDSSLSPVDFDRSSDPFYNVVNSRP